MGGEGGEGVVAVAGLGGQLVVLAEVAFGGGDDLAGEGEGAVFLAVEGEGLGLVELGAELVFAAEVAVGVVAGGWRGR